MNRETSLKPVLCIDLKKNRIRIHKLTLHMLGDPEYIQLLVNPQDSMIAIKKSVRKYGTFTGITAYGHISGGQPQLSYLRCTESKRMSCQLFHE